MKIKFADVMLTLLVIGLFAVIGTLMVHLTVLWPAQIQEHDSRVTGFLGSTGLPYKECTVDSPYLTVIAQNETEFLQAITDLNATIIYHQHSAVYVFSLDYKLAYMYIVP